MKTKYSHIAVIQKDNSLHVEANEEKKPSIEDYKFKTIDNDSRLILKIHKEEYNYDLEKWKKNNLHLPFVGMEDTNKTRLYLHDIKRQQTELNKWDASDCIEIKNSHAYFKEPKVLGIDYEFSIGENGMIEEIPIKIEESQIDLLYDLIKANTYQGTDKALQQFKIIRK